MLKSVEITQHRRIMLPFYLIASCLIPARAAGNIASIFFFFFLSSLKVSTDSSQLFRDVLCHLNLLSMPVLFL